MRRFFYWLARIGLALVATPLLSFAAAAAVPIGERPAITRHLDQALIEKGSVPFAQVVALGKKLFDAQFNRLDGQGRPGATGAGMQRGSNQPSFVRTSGPDANSCFGCHFQPRSGGGAEFASNVFVLAQDLDPVTFTMNDRRIDERGSLGMMGAGAVELLAREMSTELIRERDQAVAEAKSSGRPATVKLVAKGISFGSLTARPDGLIDPRGIEGVDWDLVVKPFHQKGAVVSLREFTVTAMNHHHGMQASERFGAGVDADRDGVADELTVGDVTALTLYQASLNMPGRVVPANRERRVAAEAGERVFAQIGCTSCHVPTMVLDDAVFSEPNPYNPQGTLRRLDVKKVISFDLTKDGPAPRVERRSDGKAVVRAYTDLKRHDLNDAELRHFANEQAAQGMLSGTAGAAQFSEPVRPRPTREFLTRKLWDAGNSAPYGHRGDLTTMTDAIQFHGGEARSSRNAYFTLSPDEQASIIEFLKTLQIVPDGAPRVVIEKDDGL